MSSQAIFRFIYNVLVILLELCESITYNWDKVFKNGSSKISGRQPLKNLKGYGLLKQTISLQNF